MSLGAGSLWPYGRTHLCACAVVSVVQQADDAPVRAFDTGRSIQPKEPQLQFGRTAFVALLGSLATCAALAHGEPERNTTREVYAGKITNIPGKSFKVVEVLYNPGAAAGAHTHAKSAFIYAYVLEGEVRSQVAGQPVRVYQVGEYWTEEPGAHHLVSENASKTKPARLLATFVVDSDDAPLTVPDRK